MSLKKIYTDKNPTDMLMKTRDEVFGGFLVIKKGIIHLEFLFSNKSRDHARRISSHHIKIECEDELNLINFEVLGRNPVWVFDSHSGEIRVFRNSEKGTVRCGDRFCVSAKNPFVFRIVLIRRTVPGSIPFALIFAVLWNPEFGFVVKGHEFDDYPKCMIRDVKDWDWFLEEKSKDDSESDEFSESGGGGGGARRKKKLKRKKKDEGKAGDEDWSGESDDEKVMVGKLKKGKRPKYVTRSKDLKKSFIDLGSSSKKVIKKAIVHGDEDEEDEETLGGFIVDDEEFKENEEEEETEDDYDSDEEEISD
ncbi:hypothetical protein Sjap_019802 [Stephania japonica]|uniref:Uncharacterized protein n=1 Tax=Stephania japonica TaxID=461633 RepID=A0AAP0F6U0_9MAGN